MELIYDGEVIWKNPEGLGHFGIKLRKQVAEEEIGEKIGRREATESLGENASGADNQQGRTTGENMESEYERDGRIKRQIFEKIKAAMPKPPSGGPGNSIPVTLTWEEWQFLGAYLLT